MYINETLKYSARKIISEHLGVFLQTLNSNQIITVSYMLQMYFNVTGINKIILWDFLKESSLKFFSLIVHTGVWIILCHTIFLPDLIMSQLHFCSLRILAALPRTGLSLHFCVFFLVPNSFTLAAAAAAANKNANNDDATQH